MDDKTKNTKDNNSVDRFMSYLRDKGIPEEETAFLTGRLAKKATSEILKETVELFDESEKDNVQKMGEEEFIAEVKKRIEEKKNITFEEYQESVYKRMVDEILGEDSA